jgi:hypothetical protein
MENFYGNTLSNSVGQFVKIPNKIRDAVAQYIHLCNAIGQQDSL